MHIVQGDVTSLDQLKTAAQKVEEVTGGELDVLVNNAAYIEIKTPGLLPSVLTSPENLENVKEALSRSIETNVLGAIYVTNTFLPLILKGKEKKIVHISSGMASSELVAKSGIAYSVPYSTSKAALNLVVAKYAAELGEKGVLVTALSPGWVNTDEGERKSHSL